MEVRAIDARGEGNTLSVSGAARVLGVHANTIRAWTDQGRLPCIRINERGDRRYRDGDLKAFLADAGLQASPAQPFQSRLRPAPQARLELPSDHVEADAPPADGPRSPVVATTQALAPTGDARPLGALSALARGHARAGDLDATLRGALRLLRDTGRFRQLAIAQWQGPRLMPRLTEGEQRVRGWWRGVDTGLARVCCSEDRPIAASVTLAPDPVRRSADAPEPAVHVYTPIGGREATAWGVLITEARPGVPLDANHLELLSAVGGVLALATGQDRLGDEVARLSAEVAAGRAFAAQLQSIQGLGSRLARLASVDEVGMAICLELRALIDYHNVRVYRVLGEDVRPIAWRGEVGEYVDEDGDQLHLRVGEGITGWVAQHGVAEYLPDASADPRSATIPGTEDDLDESMLLAPMRYDDRVIGVIVLSKLGLDQFDRDDLRYLEIYASMAAQAIVNADAAEQLRAQSARLARQLETQRELIRVTESILSSLDPRTVVAEIAARLQSLVPVDTLGLDLYDRVAGVLTPLYATGVDAAAYQGRTLTDQEGVGGWVARHGEAQLVQDELADPRVAHFDGTPVAGALIVAPLHDRDGVVGILTLERLGTEARFQDWEFELVNLFAGHVSIALANAVAHEAVEHRARTDALTGLRNQGTFAEDLQRTVVRATPFSLLLLDLDDFKSYNDRFGHEAGNRLLQAIAGALAACCREADTVYRYGGDEFALILPLTGAEGALELASRVVAAVRATDPHGVSCSVGVAAFPDDALDRDLLLAAADRACYVAKRSGRAQVVTAAEGERRAAGETLPPPTPVDELLAAVVG